MMTLEEAIQHCTEKSCGSSQCNMEHKQLRDWLIELKRFKEPEKCIYSKDDYTDEDRKVLCDGCKEECKLKISKPYD